MATETYRNVDMDGDVARAAGKLEVMTAPKGMKFKVEVEFSDNLKKEIGADPLLKQDMWLAVDAVYKDLVKRIGENLKNTDRGAVILRNANNGEKLKKLVEVVNRNIVAAKDIAQETAQKKLTDHWEDLKKKRKEYRNYKIKIVVTVTSAAAGLVTSLAIIGTSGFTAGASGAIGIVAMIKACNTLITEAVSAGMSVQQSIAALELQLGIVEKAWKKTKAGGHANEISAAVFKEFLGVSQPSVKSCQSNLSTAKSKLTGIDLKMHDIAKEVKSAMASSKKMRDDMIAAANERFKKHPDPQALQKYGPKFLANLNAYMKDADANVNTLLQRVVKNFEVLKKADADIVTLTKRVDAIAKSRDSKAYKVLDNVLMVGNASLSILNGNGLVDSLKTVAENTVPVMTCFAYERISAVVIDRDLKSVLA